jgi:hypothetical protein
LNITLIAIDNKVSGIADTRLGNNKAIIANTIAKVPRPIFVKGVVFLLRPDGFFVVVVVVDDVAAVVVVGKDEYNLNNIMPVATLSIPIVNNIIESSRITLPAAIIGNPITIKNVDNVSDIAPLTICKTRNHTGGLLLVTVDVIDWIISQ